MDDNLTWPQRALQRIASSGDRPLLMSPSESVTGGAFATEVASIADHLAMNFGIVAGDVVALCFRAQIETVRGMFALWHLGATAVVIDFRTPTIERERVCKLAGARFLFVDRAAGQLDACPIAIWQSHWREGAGDRPPTCSSAAHAAPPMIMMTSGTTGLPKLYALPARRLAFRWKDTPPPARLDVGPILAVLSLQYIAGIMQVMSSLSEPHPVYFHPVLFSARELADALIRTKAVSVNLSPATVRQLIAIAGERDEPMFPDLENLDVGGGPTLPEDKRRAYKLLSRGFSTSYASGMCGVVSRLQGPDVLTHSETEGRILPGVRVEVLDDAGQVLPEGEVGLLRIYSPKVVEADSDQGNETIGDGWLIPGDIGSVSSDGFLSIVGRVPDMIVRSGVNLSAREVEAAIMRHPKVEDCAVLGLPHQEFGQEVVAAVIAPDLSHGDLWTFCLQTITSAKRPRKVVLVPALPRNSSGKIKKGDIDLSLFED